MSKSLQAPKKKKKRHSILGNDMRKIRVIKSMFGNAKKFVLGQKVHEGKCQELRLDGLRQAVNDLACFVSICGF